MHTTIHTTMLILTAALWALGGAAVAWLATWRLRRSFAGQLAAPVLIATAATIAAILGSERAMFYASGDFRVALVVAAASGLLAAATAFLGARSLTRDKRAVAEAVRAIADGRVPAASGTRMRTELQTLRQQVADAGRDLAEAAARERDLENARRELIAWVSHDLRTPLAGLRAMSEALEDGLVDSPERYYKLMRDDVDKLTGMVEDIFELSRIQAGALRLSEDRILLTDLVSDCVASLEPLALRYGVRLRGDASGSTSGNGATLVNGDGRELNRALTNLVVNAIRHTRADGAVEIEVRSLGDPACAEVAVRDECGGIPSADIARVFEIGFRGERSRTPEPGAPVGAGLGLAITRGIAEAHAGSVDVSNIRGGCEFVLRLPAA